jgi:hypothetical protein
MRHGSARGPEDSLSRARGEFQRWRSRRRRGTRIPEALWQAAVAAGREHGVSKAAQELRLDYYRLKDRLQVAGEDRFRLEEPPGRGFVEIPLCAPCASSACVIEMEDGGGARLRLEVTGVSVSELETLMRGLWGMAG